MVGVFSHQRPSIIEKEDPLGLVTERVKGRKTRTR